jgi:hypothetical protein
LGTAAIRAGARTSDFRTWHGGASQGTSAVFLFGINDDTGSGGPIMDTLNIEAVHAAGINGATLGAQFNLDNLNSNQVCDPYTFCTTRVLLLTPGVTSPLSPNFNVSTALNIGGSGNITYHNAGIIFSSDAIAASVGPTVNGAASTVAIGMPSTNAIVWYGSSSTAWGAIYSGTAHKLNLWALDDININAGSGSKNLNINAGGSGGIIINTVPGVTCSTGINVGTFRSINGIVTAC